VQAVLMLFRQAALVILAGVLPLAAAGSIAPMTRTWVRKVTAWMLALICYKPAAAAVYAAAFTLIGTGRSLRTVLMGFVMLLLSVLMLPALMKFFTWTTGTIGSPGGGGGQLLNAATVGAIAVGAIRSPGAGGAQGQAANINSSLGPPPPGGGPAAPPSGPPSGPGGEGSGPHPGGDRPRGPAGASPGGGGGHPAWPHAGPGSGWSPWPGSNSSSDSPAGSAVTPDTGTGPEPARPDATPAGAADGGAPGAGAVEPGDRS